MQNGHCHKRKWSFKVIQGHLFWGQWKEATLYNNLGLISKASEDIDSKSTEKNRRFRPLSVD